MKIDWQRVKADYATGQFTLTELGRKYGCSVQAVSKRAKTEGWTQDLSRQVAQATAAKLIAASVDAQAQGTVDSVLAAAEVNKQVIIGHRTRAKTLLADAEMLRAKVTGMLAGAGDIREVAQAASAFEALVRATRGIVDVERKAFGLNDKQQEAPPLEAISDELLVAKLREFGIEVDV